MRISKLILRYWVIIVAILLFLLLVAFIETDVLRHTNGVFSYPLDATFIHLAIAKSLAFDQAWGTSQYEFSAVSFSLLYPVLLAAVFFIFGAHAIIAFIINLASGMAVLVVMQRWLALQGIKSLYQWVILSSIILLVPVPVIVMCGMEYALQLLFGFLFITQWWQEWIVIPTKLSMRLYTYTVLLIATRYECLVLVLIICIIMLLRHKWILSLKLALWSLLPLLLSGLIVVSKDNRFPSYSILLQSLHRSFHYEGLNLRLWLPLLYLMGCMTAFTGTILVKSGVRAFQALHIVTRYTAGLCATGLLIALLIRSKDIFQEVEQASINVYNQEYQVGRFLSRYYKKSRMAFTGVWTTGYFMEGWKINITGWNATSDSLYNLNAKLNIELAVCDDNYNNPQLLNRWTLIASWAVHKNTEPGDRTITIYAIDSSERKPLYKYLKDFEPHLTKEVVVKYYYTPPLDTTNQEKLVKAPHS